MIKLTSSGKLIAPGMATNLQKQVKTAVEKATLDFITQMKTRTLNGVGYDGSSFGKYSKGYAAFRKEQGRSTSPVSLYFDGEMFRAIKFKVTQMGEKFIAIVDFATALAQKKAANIINNQKRNFFGISDREEQAWNAKVKDLISLKEANK